MKNNKKIKSQVFTKYMVTHSNQISRGQAFNGNLMLLPSRIH